MTAIPAALPMSPEQAAWLAGLLDGEGCFDAQRNNPRIRVKMSDHDVILRAADLMGATTYHETARQPHHKPCMVAQITGDRAVSVMRSVLPYLGIRRSAKVMELITANATRQALKGRRHLKVAA